MKIGGLILGQGINRIVRDGRTEKSGHFIEPIVGSFPQVDNTGCLVVSSGMGRIMTLDI